MRRDDTSAPGDEPGSGDWTSGPWGPADPDPALSPWDGEPSSPERDSHADAARRRPDAAWPRPNTEWPRPDAGPPPPGRDEARPTLDALREQIRRHERGEAGSGADVSGADVSGSAGRATAPGAGGESGTGARSSRRRRDSSARTRRWPQDGYTGDRDPAGPPEGADPTWFTGGPGESPGAGGRPGWSHDEALPEALLGKDPDPEAGRGRRRRGRRPEWSPDSPGDPGTDRGWRGGRSGWSPDFSGDPESSGDPEAGRGRRRRGRRSGWLPDGPQEGSPAAQGQDADPESVARAICLRLLTMAPRTRAQLADALRKREVPEEAAQAVLERFSEVGLIDDEAFAAAWVSSRHAGRGLARRALAQELRHRGVDEETVKDAVGQLDPEQEVETARALVAKKLASTRGADPRARTRKLVGMLARKGYSPGLAFRVVREALEAEGVESDDLPDDFG
ncbi:hypothetical protein GCM10009530_00860 [Microbispora corallina]|uniref:Regulatory protein RecX n=1 Tax=Microbispora corallina TaxID=83302 RepID=A0ABQ4FSE2_9ACTN|nr:recombination regulator RecX [Microbispora corallina]GIH37686.1 hypothetical protein Mco01_06860 [Microbispora corallina]